MTSGGLGGTSGKERRAILLALLLFAATGLAFAVVNAVTVIDDRARWGRPVDNWEPWTWELTSLVSLLLIAPAVMWISLRLQPPRFAWRRAILIHLLMTIPMSLFHVLLMSGFREAIYFMVGRNYGDQLTSFLLYEYRKDLITYAALAFLPHLTMRLLRQQPSRLPEAASHPIDVRDGSRRRLVAPAELDWAQAAGNYVELHGGFGMLLHRQTLAGLEADLIDHGFVRIHRSRIVRAAAISALETNPSGDFEVTLSSGTKVSGSRRYRNNLDVNPCA